jgi:hypothetical protein
MPKICKLLYSYDGGLHKYGVTIRRLYQLLALYFIRIHIQNGRLHIWKFDKNRLWHKVHSIAFVSLAGSNFIQILISVRIWCIEFSIVLVLNLKMIAWNLS